MGSTASKGVFLMIWGKPEYGFMAYNLAMSIKKHSPSLAVHLLTDDSAISRIDTSTYFDGVTFMETPKDPALAKIKMYDYLPFEYNLFLDVDGICISDLTKQIDSLIADDKPFRCHVHAYYDSKSPDEMPQMVWAARNTIWDHYSFTSERMPATQSSLLFIKKCEFSENLYFKMQANYLNKIPIQKLKETWGGGQPDELYLNVTLAQLNYDPSCNNIIWFADNHSRSISEIEKEFTLLSLFGTRHNVKPVFERYYDSLLSKISQDHGHRLYYKWKNIKGSKHANVFRQMKQHPRSATKGRYIRHAPFEVKDLPGKITVYSSYYTCENKDRQNELIDCLKRNSSNNQIDEIFLFVDKLYEFASDKITQVINPRPTYQDFVKQINLRASYVDYSVIINSDIYLDDTINWVKQINMDGVMLALSRYDVTRTGPVLAQHEYSQDTWIFQGKVNLTGGDYYLGLPQCDNRIAFDASASGYRVYNPSIDIKTYHLHLSGFRTYTQKDKLLGHIMPVFITSIAELIGKQLTIIQPGKVGDIICILPICEYYHKKGYSVEVQCPLQYHSLFNYVNYAKPVVHSKNRTGKIIDLSFGINTRSDVHRTWIKSQGRLESFVQLKYEIANVPYEVCRNLNINRNTSRENDLYSLLIGDDPTPFALVQDGSDYGKPIIVNHERIILFKPVLDYMIFDWMKVIESAQEIHVIDSSLCNLVDTMNVEADLYYYKTFKVPNKWDETVLRNNWVKVDGYELEREIV